MPDTIISQFRRAFNSPIETDRKVNTLTDLYNINQLTRWEGMLVYVVSEEATYILKGGVEDEDFQPLVNSISVNQNGIFETTGYNVVSSTGSDVNDISEMTIPANTLQDGDKVILKYQGVLKYNNGDSTNLKLKSYSIAPFALISHTNNDADTGGYAFDVEATFQRIGADMILGLKVFNRVKLLFNDTDLIKTLVSTTRVTGFDFSVAIENSLIYNAPNNSSNELSVYYGALEIVKKL